jgi:hypothetical protein
MLCTLILESVCTGDESKPINPDPTLLLTPTAGFQLRRRHADTIVSALAAGLHRLDYGTSKLTTALEYKRRLISGIYCTDKNESSMNGVPVALSQKFCHLRLPLDLTEEELFLPPDELARAVSNLDPDGWNRKGEISHVTSNRGIQILSRCREKILDIALGVDLAISPQEIE